MRAPSGLGIPRGYPFLHRFKLLNICKGLRGYIYLSQRYVFIRSSINYLSII